MAAGRRPDAAAQYFPARWIDVSTTEQVVRDAVQAAMRRRHYSARSTTADGVTMYRFGSRGLGFLSDMLSAGLILRIMGRPHEAWAQIAAWTTPVEGGLRVTISLLDGMSHSSQLRSMLVELIETFRRDDVLIDASPLFSGLDLPLESPGRPSQMHRARRQGSRTQLRRTG
jgi:hypothetical protein